MLPDAAVAHRSRGRVRIKVPSKKGDQSYFSLLRERLLKHPGIKEVKVNPTTASALIIHELDDKTLGNIADDEKLFDLGVLVLEKAHLPGYLRDIFKGFDSKVKTFTGNELDVRTLTFLALLAVGAFQIGRGKTTTPPWHQAFWYALNIFLKGEGK